VRSFRSGRAKRVLLCQVAPRYREATHLQKLVALDEFLGATGYAREYAIRLLAKPATPPANSTDSGIIPWLCGPGSRARAAATAPARPGAGSAVAVTRGGRTPPPGTDFTAQRSR
jgi:hypothetical protein